MKHIKNALSGGFYFYQTNLSLCFLKSNAFAQRRIELLQLDFALGGLSIFASPDNVVGLRGFEPKQAVLRHRNNLAESGCLSNSGGNHARRPRRALLHFEVRIVVLDGDSHRTALQDSLIDHKGREWGEYLVLNSAA